MRKTTKNVNKNNEMQSNVHKPLNLENSVEKQTKFKNPLLLCIIRRSSNDTTHSPLRWIYLWTKIHLTKKSFEYVVPPH